MNRHLALIITLMMLCYIPSQLNAQGSKKKSSKEPAKVAKAEDGKQDPKPDPKPAAPGAEKGFSMGNAMGGFDFRKIVARKMIYDPSGQFTLDGGVNIDSDQFKIDCGHLVADPDKKTMMATGTPVKVQLEAVRARCQNFVYNTEKKTAQLRGNPEIIQRDSSGKDIRVSGDIIYLAQNEEGEWGFTVDMLPNSNKTPVIEVLGGGKPKTTEKKDAKPVKVGTDNLAEIKVPGLE